MPINHKRVHHTHVTVTMENTSLSHVQNFVIWLWHNEGMWQYNEGCVPTVLDATVQPIVIVKGRASSARDITTRCYTDSLARIHKLQQHTLKALNLDHLQPSVIKKIALNQALQHLALLKRHHHLQVLISESVHLQMQKRVIH